MKRSKCEGGNTVITVLGFADKEIYSVYLPERCLENVEARTFRCEIPTRKHRRVLRLRKYTTAKISTWA